MQVEWTDEMDLRLLQATNKHRPIGPDKHWQLLSITKNFNRKSQQQLLPQQLYQRLAQLLDLEEFERLDEELSDTEDFPNKIRHQNMRWSRLKELRDFCLYPPGEYEQIMQQRSQHKKRLSVLGSDGELSALEDDNDEAADFEEDPPLVVGSSQLLDDPAAPAASRRKGRASLVAKPAPVTTALQQHKAASRSRKSLTPGDPLSASTPGGGGLDSASTAGSSSPNSKTLMPPPANTSRSTRASSVRNTSRDVSPAHSPQRTSMFPPVGTALDDSTTSTPADSAPASSAKPSTSRSTRSKPAASASSTPAPAGGPVAAEPPSSAVRKSKRK